MYTGQKNITIFEGMLIQAGSVFYREVTREDIEKAITDPRFEILELPMGALQYLTTNDIKSVSKSVKFSRIEGDKAFYSYKGDLCSQSVRALTGADRPKGTRDMSKTLVFITPLFQQATRSPIT